MEVLFQRARSLASEAAKRSQDLAIEAAKFSHEFALETAKRSKEIAVEASKKADQLKALAVEISPSIASVGAGISPAPSASTSFSEEEELAEYGVSPELREFVNGLTINTFQDFPSDDPDSSAGTNDLNDIGTSNTRQDLTEWQERHALLVLKAVPEISQFRYLLCPQQMKESRFWKIYFTLVRSHVLPYEAQSSVHGDTVVADRDQRFYTAASVVEEPVERSETLSNPTEAPKKNASIDDQDLDAYLLSALGSDADVEDDGFDADFDQLVNSGALDSDTEEKNDTKMPSMSSVRIAATSDGSSDGELVEFPSDLDTQANISKAE